MSLLVRPLHAAAQAPPQCMLAPWLVWFLCLLPSTWPSDSSPRACTASSAQYIQVAAISLNWEQQRKAEEERCRVTLHRVRGQAPTRGPCPALSAQHRPSLAATLLIHSLHTEQARLAGSAAP